MTHSFRFLGVHPSSSVQIMNQANKNSSFGLTGMGGANVETYKSLGDVFGIQAAVDSMKTAAYANQEMAAASSGSNVNGNHSIQDIPQPRNNPRKLPSSSVSKDTMSPFSAMNGDHAGSGKNVYLVTPPNKKQQVPEYHYSTPSQFNNPSDNSSAHKRLQNSSHSDFARPNSRRTSSSQHRLSTYSTASAQLPPSEPSSSSAKMGFFRGKMDFSRASYNEKNNRHQGTPVQQGSKVPDRSVSTTGYNHTNVETTSSNVLPGFTKPTALRTVNSMYKSNTSLDLDLEVSLVERAVSNVQIMNNGGVHLHHPHNNVHQIPAGSGNIGERRLPHIGHNTAKMRDFSGSHGSIVDVLSSRQFSNEENEGQRNFNYNTRYV